MSNRPRTDATFRRVYERPAYAHEIVRQEMEKLECELAQSKARLEEIGDLKQFLGVPIGTFNPDKVSFCPVGDGTCVLKVVDHGFLLDSKSVERLAGELPYSKREDKWRECARELARRLRTSSGSEETRQALARFDELEKGEK